MKNMPYYRLEKNNLAKSKSCRRRRMCMQSKSINYVSSTLQGNLFPFLNSLVPCFFSFCSIVGYEERNKMEKTHVRFQD